MNRRLMGILSIAFLVAVVCSYIVYRMVGSRLVASPLATTPVVSAATDIKLGSVLRRIDLSTTNMAGTLPKGAMVKFEDVVGRGVTSNLYAGEPIMESRLAAVGSGGGLAATIPQGMRASAVKVDEVVGVAGFVTPGMRVDVLISGTPPGVSDPTEGTKVKTLLQNIQVLSAGTDIQKDAEGKPQQVQVVNLLVTPEQAETLSLASNQTRIQLVLRNPLDTEIAETTGTNMANLFAGKNTAPVKPQMTTTPRRAAPKPSTKIYVIEIFNGSKRSEEKFASNGEKQ